MSNFLMIYIDKNTSFDLNTITRAIHSLDNAEISIYKSEYGEGNIKYELDNETINITIGKDWKYIAIEHTGKIAFDFAFKLNKLLNTNLSLTDSDYSFVCKLNKINSVQELESIIIQSKSIYMNE